MRRTGGRGSRSAGACRCQARTLDHAESDASTGSAAASCGCPGIGQGRGYRVTVISSRLLCLALDDRPLFLTEATRLLFSQLSPASRRLLAVPGTATTERAFLAAYRRVRYC